MWGKKKGYKQSTDDASNGNPSPAGGGGVLRGHQHQGDWQCSLGEEMGYYTSMKAELKAVCRGLHLAKSMNIPKIWIQLDSLLVFGTLKGSITWSMSRY